MTRSSSAVKRRRRDGKALAAAADSRVATLPLKTTADPIDLVLNAYWDIPTFQLIRLRDVIDVHLENRAANGEVA